MADRKAVIEQLESMRDYHRSAGNNITADIANDAVELLKEQEPIQMKVSEDYGSIKFGECPKCKSFINNRSFPKSCGCGQAVKWE